MKEITIDGTVYVPKGSEVSVRAKSVKGMEYCIVRTYSAGVFAGYFKRPAKAEGVVYQARRLWYWSGAASLSQLAVDGVAKPEECKFPCEVAEVELTNIIEVIPCSEKARESIAGVSVWKM